MSIYLLALAGGDFIIAMRRRGSQRRRKARYELRMIESVEDKQKAARHPDGNVSAASLQCAIQALG